MQYHNRIIGTYYFIVSCDEVSNAMKVIQCKYLNNDPGQL